MRKMRDSGIDWVGAIPNHWRVSKIKQIVRWKSVKGQPDLPVLSLYRDYGVIPKDSRDDNHNVTSLDTSGYKVVEHGDLVINKMKAWQGSLAVSEYNGIVSPAYHICKITSENICKKYLHYLLRDASYLPEYMRLSTGLRVGQWDLSFDDFKNIPFLVPPLAEQERIAALLDAECAEIDAVLEKTRASIEEYKKLKQAVITQAVTKGIRGDRPMKDSGIEWIGDIPAEWEIKRIKNICSLKTGSTPSTGNAEWFNGDLLWFTPGDFNEKFVLLSSNRTLSRTAEKDGVATMIPANSVLVVCIGGSAGKVGYTNYGCSCNQQITALCKSNIMPKLLMYDVNAGMPFLRNTTMFTTLPILNNQAIGGLVLPIPREEEQLSIIEYLDEKCAGIDALVAKKQQYLTEIENYKKSLIYEYVTGKREV